MDNTTVKDFKVIAKYELKRNEEIGTDLLDKTMFLFKNGKICACPHTSGTVNSPQGLRNISNPCGDHCQHFNLFHQKRKEVVDAVEKMVPTGMLDLLITCGAGQRLPIANIQLEVGKPMPTLTVEK